RFLDIDLVGLHSHEDDLRLGRHGFDAAGDLDAVEKRQADVEQDEIRAKTVDGFDCGPPVRDRSNDFEVGLEQSPESVNEKLMIVNDEQANLWHRGRLTSL